MDTINKAGIAYEEIKQLILKNQLRPGSFISENEICTMVPLGRTPVREAIIRLSCDGLLNIHSRRGIEICNLAPKKLYDVYEIRTIVEPELFKQSFDKVNKNNIALFSERFRKSGELVKQGDADAAYNATQVDMEFHIELLKATNNIQYLNIMRQFFDYMTIIRVAGKQFNSDRFVSSIDEHEEIIQSILHENKDESVYNLRQHIQESYFYLLRDLTNVF